MQFAEIDFQAVEGEEIIPATLSVTGDASTNISLIVTPYTFDEYEMQFGVSLPTVIADRSEGLDRAECELAVSSLVKQCHVVLG